MGQNFISDLFSGIAHVGSTAENDFIDDDSEGEKVGLERVVHSADDLRGHVSRSAAGLFRVVGFFFSGDSEIGKAEVSIFL
jgi:hypothetical protein